MKNEVIAIGDIHGCVESLRAIWNKLEPWKDRPHIFIGDYIDRGPDSKGVVDFLIENQHERDVIFLRGNHEQMLIDSIEKGHPDLWLRNGGTITLTSYDVDNPYDIPDEHLDFYKATKLYHETDTHFFVHAGVPPVLSVKESKNTPSAAEYMLWGREHLNAFDVPWEKTVVFGHTPRAYPIRKPGMLGIDTGCCYDHLGLGKLTAVVLPEVQFIQQSSLDG